MATVSILNPLIAQRTKAYDCRKKNFRLSFIVLLTVGGILLFCIKFLSYHVGFKHIVTYIRVDVESDLEPLNVEQKPILIVAMKGYRGGDTSIIFNESETLLPVGCEYTHNWDSAHIADAGVYHIPEYKTIPLPIPKLSVAYCTEPSHVYHWLPHFPGYNMSITYSNESEVYYPYFNFDFYDASFPTRDFFALEKAAVMVISNCFVTSHPRLVLAETIMKYMPVYSYGKCLHNAEFATGNESNLWYSQKIRNIRNEAAKRMFFLAFENSNSDQYVSEKIQNGLMAGVIPVYYGTRDVFQYLPDPNAIIFVDDFPTFEAVGEYMKKVSDDINLYNKHQAWRSKPIPEWIFKKIDTFRENWKLRLCRKVYEKTRIETKILPPLA